MQVSSSYKSKMEDLRQVRDELDETSSKREAQEGTRIENEGIEKCGGATEAIRMSVVATLPDVSVALSKDGAAGARA